jgi:hypothetical protein
MANIYVKSSAADGNSVQNGAQKIVFDDVSVAQLTNRDFQKAFDVARDAYQAISKKEISDLEILNITENCTVISANFKYGNERFKLNVFKNKLDQDQISSYTQICPLQTNSDEPHFEAEFKGTEVAKLIEKSIELFIEESLKIA